MWHVCATCFGVCGGGPAAFCATCKNVVPGAQSSRQCTYAVLSDSCWASRLPHGAPSQAEAVRIAYNCPNLRALDATGCAQVLPESLQVFAHIPFQVSFARPALYSFSKFARSVCGPEQLQGPCEACAVNSKQILKLKTAISVLADMVSASRIQILSFQTSILVV